MPGGAGREHQALIADLTRRGFLQRAGALGLPARPGGFRIGVPSEIVGQRVVAPVPPPPRRRPAPRAGRPARSR